MLRFFASNDAWARSAKVLVSSHCERARRPPLPRDRRRRRLAWLNGLLLDLFETEFFFQLRAKWFPPSSVDGSLDELQYNLVVPALVIVASYAVLQFLLTGKKTVREITRRGSRSGRRTTWALHVVMPQPHTSVTRMARVLPSCRAGEVPSSEAPPRALRIRLRTLRHRLPESRRACRAEWASWSHSNMSTKPGAITESCESTRLVVCVSYVLRIQYQLT